MSWAGKARTSRSGRLPTQDSIGRPLAAATLTEAPAGFFGPSSDWAGIALLVTPVAYRSSERDTQLSRRRAMMVPMSVSHVFSCDRCHGEAGRVTLFGRGEVIPRATGGSLAEVGAVMSKLENTDAERPRLQVLSGVGDLTMFEFDLDATLSALGAADARSLHALDLETVPFWCPRCDASYCAQHWTTWDLFDDGFFDEKRGTCPSGHERRIID